MDIKKQVDILIKGRKLMLKAIDGLSIEQINTVPEGFKNNIGWNIAHLVVTQQLLHYKLSGLDCLVSDQMIHKYRKGTAVDGHVISQTEWQEIKEKFLELPIQLEKDYVSGKFESYHEYQTSVGVVLDSIDKAISFNSFHEGIHLGVILAQKKPR